MCFRGGHIASRECGHAVTSDVIPGAGVGAGPFFMPRATPLSSTDGKMTEVRLNEGDSVDRALKLFRKKLQRVGLFKELRRRRFYVKPSAARVIKSAEARRRKRKRHQAYD